MRVIKLFWRCLALKLRVCLAANCCVPAHTVGAQYREAQRAKSTPDFISKIEGATQELEESRYWLELLGEGAAISPKRLAPLLDESAELVAIFMTIAKRAKGE